MRTIDFPKRGVLLGDLDFVRWSGKTIPRVRTITKRHHARFSAPAPRLDNLPIRYDKVGTVLG